jgi:ATP/maltotriose-dependent transcriptional regulator MalT
LLFIVYNVLVSDILLQTKLFRPAPPPTLVTRSHLINRLNDGLGVGAQGFGARLTLVSAPAGFGKTTLISAWLAGMATHPSPLSSENIA